jgi:Flp pilus assembly protein TadB
MNAWTYAALRLSDRDRKGAVRRLEREHRRGRIDKAELEERLDGVASARTRGDLGPVFADLVGLPVPRGPQSLGFRHHHGRRLVRLPVLALLVIGIVIAATGHIPWVAIAVAAVLILVFAPWRRRRWVGRRHAITYQHWAC